MLLDRRVELEALDRFLEAVREGLGGALVLLGGPGIGKALRARLPGEAH
jgi:hypothetical protein